MVLTCFNLLKYVLSISSPENQHVCKHDHSNIWAFICQYSMFLAHKYPQPPAASQTLLSKRLFPRYPTPRPVASRRGGKCQKISPSELLLQNPFTLSDHIWPLVYLLPVSLDIYIYNYYIIYIYIIYCNLLLISTPLRLVSKTAFTAAKCSPMLASLPAKWEPKCATCSPSWRCTCPRQLRTRSRKKSAGFQKWFPMSFEVLLALTSLFIIGLFSDVQLWFFMVFHHFSCLFSWWLWAILGTALPFRGRPRSSSTAKRPPGPRAQMRLSSVTLRPWSFLGRNYQKLGTDVRKKKGR